MTSSVTATATQHVVPEVLDSATPPFAHLKLYESLLAVRTLFAPIGRLFIPYALVRDAANLERTHKYPLHFIAWVKHNAFDVGNWQEFDAVLTKTALLGPEYGVGLVLGETGHLVAIDVDNGLLPDGIWHPFVFQLCQRFGGAYIETSQSGRGLHIIFSSDRIAPHTITFKPDQNCALTVSIYTCRRFIALTGCHAKGNPLAKFTAEFHALVGEHYQPVAAAATSDEWTSESVGGFQVLSDDELLARLEARRASLVQADAAALALEFPKEPGGYNESDADMSLAWWTLLLNGGNCEQAERVMRCTKLARSKWDRGEYLHKTMRKARESLRSSGHFRPLTELFSNLPDFVPPARVATPDRPDGSTCALGDFFAFLPGHGFLYVPTREIWPAASVDGALPWPAVEGSTKTCRPSAWLDSHRQIHQVTWHPGEPELICDQVVNVSGWSSHPGARVFNLYKAPLASTAGDPAAAGPWISHVRTIYPDEATEIIAYLAFKTQWPGVKINHALVFGGAQGIGKDTILEPVKAAVGAWNWQEISPTQMLGRFNGWTKAVIVRLSEARNLGEINRFSFYENSKAYIAAPPDVIRVDEKNLREHYVVNVLGLIITTNNKTDGLYLPADDRRHFVAWSNVDKTSFTDEYWQRLWKWYGDGGVHNVVAYLRNVDLTDYNPKAPPRKTAAFWAIVQASEAPESGELRDVLDAMVAAGLDTTAITLGDLSDRADAVGLQALAAELRDRTGRRSIPHKLERIGYEAVHNPDAKDGLWTVRGRRQAMYANTGLPISEQIRAARSRCNR